MTSDEATDAEIARLLAAEQPQFYDYEPEDASDNSDDSDYGGGGRKKAKKPGAKRGRPPGKAKKAVLAATAAAAAAQQEQTVAEAGGGAAGEAALGAAPNNSDGDHADLTATGRRKRTDTGKPRTASRAWSEEEEARFAEALALHGRDWKAGAGHIGTRDHRALGSHAQKHFIKMLLRGEELPPKVAETGRGYTLSGRPLDPNSASARAYGLKPALFEAVAATGKLEVGVHVTGLEMDPSGPVSKPQRAKPGPAGGDRPAPAAKRAKRSSADGANTTSEDGPATNEEAAAAQVAAGPTEYARNRPRRAPAGGRARLGETTESLELTLPRAFVGAPGTGAPLAQPFSVTLAAEALLVMDFHAHLSACEVIGLLGGTFDPEARALTVRQAFPCRRADGSDSGTSVELDPECQVEVAGAMAESGMVPVGWYHSHPVFEARPSAKDNENQRNYQALCSDAGSGLEPWVGAIVGPYDDQLPTPVSETLLWVVRTHAGELAPYTIRASVVGVEVMPGESVEAHMATALQQLAADPWRVDLSERWRPYTALQGGQPAGPPLSRAQKLRASLSRHLPRGAEHEQEVAEFLGRVMRAVEHEWGVVLPSLPRQDEAAGPPQPEAAAAPGQPAEAAVAAAAAPAPPEAGTDGGGGAVDAAAPPSGEGAAPDAAAA